METQQKETPLPDRPARRSSAFWAVVVLAILLNIWYDYYHPLGISLM
jgi:hypothetical protein